MNKLILLFFVFMSQVSYGFDVASFYLTPEWKVVDKSKKNNFSKYFDEKKYYFVNIYYTEKSGVYALVREENFNNFRFKNLCISEIKMRYLSKEMADLNLNEFLLGKRYYQIDGVGKFTCDISASGAPMIYSIGLVEDSYAGYILKNTSKIKAEVNSDGRCKVDHLEYFEQKRNGLIEINARDALGAKYIIELEGELNNIRVVRCNQILD